MAAKVNETPGPGYYDTPSAFDLNPTGNAQHDNDFLVHLNAAKKRHSSSFESKTARDALLKEIERRKYDPGPGYYELPKAIEVKTKPPNQQFFTTSEERFKDVMSINLFYILYFYYIIFLFSPNQDLIEF